MLFSGEMTGDADDLYYDDATAKVFVSGGAGAVSIFQQVGGGAFKQTANIPTRSGARTSLLAPQLRMFFVAARAVSGAAAELQVYKLSR